MRYGSHYWFHKNERPGGGYQWILDRPVTKFFADERWTRIPVDVSQLSSNLEYINN